ncbi:unnamed protein product, partial [Chrysoparadoxa australica]
ERYQHYQRLKELESQLSGVSDGLGSSSSLTWAALKATIERENPEIYESIAKACCTDADGFQLPGYFDKPQVVFKDWLAGKADPWVSAWRS